MHLSITYLSKDHKEIKKIIQKASHQVVKWQILFIYTTAYEVRVLFLLRNLDREVLSSFPKIKMSYSIREREKEIRKEERRGREGSVER